MNLFAYPAIITPDTQKGGFVVTFIDLLEAVTKGENLTDALHKAVDCLEEAIIGRISDNEFIPQPSSANEGHYLVHLPAQTALKTALYHAMRSTFVSETTLAERLNCDEQEIHYLLDPHHDSQLLSMEKALQALGHQLVIGSMVKDSTLWVSLRSKNPAFFS